MFRVRYSPSRIQEPALHRVRVCVASHCPSRRLQLIQLCVDKFDVYIFTVSSTIFTLQAARFDAEAHTKSFLFNLCPQSLPPLSTYSPGSLVTPSLSISAYLLFLFVPPHFSNLVEKTTLSNACVVIVGLALYFLLFFLPFLRVNSLCLCKRGAD